MPDFAPVPCGTIVFRAILSKDWITNDTEVHWLSFQLREDDDGKISLLISPEAAEVHFGRPTFGNISVHVGRVKDIPVENGSLNVEQDKPDHFSLIGLPNFWNVTENSKRKALKSVVKNLCEDIAEKASRIHNLSELYNEAKKLN